MATRSSCCFQAAEEAASRLRLMGDTPNWEVLSAGLRPEEGRRVKHRERDPTQPRHGWQKVVEGPRATPGGSGVASSVFLRGRQ